MTIYCIVCKKEPIGDKSRSFHKFPDDAILKQQWLTAIGRCSVAKSTKICSDHFDNNAFHDTDGITQRRRLLPSAVPCKLVNTNKVLFDTTGDGNIVTKNFTQFNSQNEQCSWSNSVDIIDELVSVTSNDLPENITNTVGENQEKWCKSVRSAICHSSVAADTDSRTAVSKEDSVTESTKDLSTRLFSQQTMLDEPTASKTHRNLERSLPLCDVTDVSLNKRFNSHEECESTLVNEGSIEPEQNIIRENVKRSLACIDESDVLPTKQFLSDELDTSMGKDHSVSTELESNKGQAGLKRSVSKPIDVSNIPATKKIRFYDGAQPMQLSRQDFVSDEAWTRFLKYYRYKNRQIESLRKKVVRKIHRIGNRKELIMKLQD